MTRPTRAVLWLGGLVAAGVTLRVSATGDLAAPPLASPGGWVDWVDARDPVAAAVGLVRLVAELAVWYTLAISAMHVAAGALRVAGAHRVADALALPAVGRLVRAGLGLGIVAASSMSPTEPGPATPGVASMAPAPRASSAVLAPSSGTATMRPVPDAPASPIDDASRVAPLTSWTVAPGESLWSIAEEVLADAWGRQPSSGEVDPFWRSLIERNRGRLVDPDDPDLIHPGQVLELPPLL